MSHFSYGNHSKKRIGVWLRYRSNPDLITMINKDRNLRTSDSVNRIVVTEYDKKTKEVWLEVWCTNFLDIFFKKHRYNVFYLKTKPNEDWICEGDLGKGLKK